MIVVYILASTVVGAGLAFLTILLGGSLLGAAAVYFVSVTVVTLSLAVLVAKSDNAGRDRGVAEPEHGRDVYPAHPIRQGAGVARAASSEPSRHGEKV